MDGGGKQPRARACGEREVGRDVACPGAGDIARRRLRRATASEAGRRNEQYDAIRSEQAHAFHRGPERRYGKRKFARVARARNLMPMPSGETTVEFGRRCRHCGSELSAASSFCSRCGATAAAVGPDADALREKLRGLFGADLDIERELGRGGMAAVYAAFDPALQRRVAVKMLLPEVADDHAAAERFLKEARTVAALQHPNVVTVYSVRSRDAVHAIVMQLVQGRGLDAVLHERSLLPAHVAAMLLAQTAAGLQHAHERGVIHRDVKPSNVLIDRDGRAVVSDFGIARREGGAKTTDTGMVVGTWAYMSPEQRMGVSVTPATDQYALGVMAFELLAGRLPFEGTAQEVLHAHINAPPPSVRELRADVPAAVDGLIQRMMAKNPGDRLPSLREAERVFGTLVPDEGQTTLQLAAYSHVRAAGGSQVMSAQPMAAGGGNVPAASAGPVAREARPAAGAQIHDVRSAPTLRTNDVPGAPAAGRPRRMLPALVGAVAGLAALAVAWQFTRHGPDGADATQAGARGNVASTQTTTPPPTGAAQPDLVQPPQPPGSGARGAAAPPADRPTGAKAGAPGDAPEAPRDRGGAGSALVGTVMETPGAAPLAGAGIAAPPRMDEPRADAGVAPSPGSARSGQPAEAVTATAPAASRDDARRLGRDFVTLLNQRQYRDVAAIPAIGGDAAARDELIRLVQSAPDFAAGFDRLPASPTPWARGFDTEFDLDLEWRGGKKLMRVHLFASQVGGTWRIAGVAVGPPD